MYVARARVHAADSAYDAQIRYRKIAIYANHGATNLSFFRNRKIAIAAGY